MKILRKVLSSFIIFDLVVIFLLTSIPVGAEDDIKLQLYFSPHIMNDVTGEIVVDVNLQNKNLAVPSSYGDISGLIFGFEYDHEQFDIKRDESGKVEFIIDEKYLIKDKSMVEVRENGETILFDFTDSTFKDNLIKNDGKVCSFTLYAKNVRSLWNSFDKYPLMFVPGTVGFVTYNLQGRSITAFNNFEAFNAEVGGYNDMPTLKSASVDKTIAFTAGKGEIVVDDATYEIDAIPYIEGGKIMIPLRHFAEHIGMKVGWDSEKAMATAYANYKSMSVLLKSKALYINLANQRCIPSPIEIDGRTYIPSDVVSLLFDNAKIETDLDNGNVSIFIP